MRLGLEHEFQSGTPPEQFAAQLYGAMPPDMRGLITSISPDEVLSALSDDAKTVDSPLLTREGQQWFRRAWDAVSKLSREAN